MSDPNPDQTQPQIPVDPRLIPEDFQLSFSESGRMVVSYAAGLDMDHWQKGQAKFEKFKESVGAYLMSTYSENSDLILQNPSIVEAYAQHILTLMSPIDYLYTEIRMELAEMVHDESLDHEALYTFDPKSIDFQMFLTRLVIRTYESRKITNIGIIRFFREVFQKLGAKKIDPDNPLSEYNKVVSLQSSVKKTENPIKELIDLYNRIISPEG